MIKLRLTTPHGPLIILGLSDVNINRMREDKPVGLDLNQLGLGPGVLVIVTGETESDIEADLRLRFADVWPDVQADPKGEN